MVIKTFFSIAVAVFVFGFSLFIFTCILPATVTVKAEEVKWTPPKNSKSILGVNIANNGMVYIKNARVESISRTSMVVSTSWNVAKLEWIINTNESYYTSHHFGTSFLSSTGKTLSIDDIRVGDSISISGNLDVNYSTPTIQANAIRMSQ